MIHPAPVGGTGPLTFSSPETAWLKVCVCVCTRHRPDELWRCLHSIRHSTVPVAQIVVSDDSRPEDRRTERLVAQEFSDVVYVQGPRVGLGANRNRAIQEVTAGYVLFLDDDAELAPDFLERMFRFAREGGLEDRDVLSGLERKAGHLVAPHDQNFLGYQNRPYSLEAPMNTAVINATLFPRALFDAVRFDEQLVYGCDEVDLITRARQAGYSVRLNPEAVNFHHHTDTGRDYYQPYYEASRLYVTLKRYMKTERSPLKGLLFALVAPAHLLAHNMRHGGVRGASEWFRSLNTAMRYIIRHPWIQRS